MSSGTIPLPNETHGPADSSTTTAQQTEQVAQQTQRRRRTGAAWAKKAAVLLVLAGLLFVFFQMTPGRPGPTCAPDCTMVDLSDADLSQAAMRSVIFLQADLRGSDLRESDLYFADLTQANLRDAPVEINRAGRDELLRVPGIGPKLADVIVQARTQGTLTELAHLARLGVRDVQKTGEFVLLNGRQPAQQLALFAV